jgi:glycine/D-amino acid oxidase-like deaminating enzyme
MSGRIVVCGAGIAGVSAAYQLSVVHGAGAVTLVEQDAPLSLTSDKSTEAYRNWWPGSDRTMTAFMNRSIDLLEALARRTGNRINMNRRGYLFASSDPGKISTLIEAARQAEINGAGFVRFHENPASRYDPAPHAPFDTPLSGVDILTDRTLISRHFPYLSPETCVVAHARRAGWLSAQQLGMTMLEAARDAGVELVRGRLSRISAPSGCLESVTIERGGGIECIEAAHLIIAAGPRLIELSKSLGLNLPIFAERHYKISFSDATGALPRTAPMVIWLDGQRLPWTEEERQILSSDPSTHWLTEEFPAGVHGRPDGAATTVLALFNYENAPADVVYPLPEVPHYGEITLRGMTTMIPSMKTCVDTGVRPYIDGGYYVKTRENRPLITPTAIAGVTISGAYSGFGIMAACAGGELAAKYALGLPLPDYASAFALSRYDDPAYRAMLEIWGDGSQL